MTGNKRVPVYDALYKILLIGDSSVGKSCMLLRYCDDAYASTFITTIGIDFKIKTIQLDGLKIKLQIWDTAGQERFHTITTAYYRGAMGIIIVYDISNEKSFENITKWIRNIKKHAAESCVKLLIGNKCDLENERVIKTDVGIKLAKEHGVKFFETSAKSSINIEEAFASIVNDIHDGQRTNKISDTKPSNTVDINKTNDMPPAQRCC